MNTFGVKIQTSDFYKPILHCLKITQNVTFEFFNFDTFNQFFPIESDLSDNTVWPQTLSFQKLARIIMNICPFKM